MSTFTANRLSRFFRSGVGVRLLMPLAVLTASLTALLVVLQLLAAHKTADESLDNYADLLGRTVLDGVHDAMLADDRPRLKRQLSRFANSEDVRRIDLLDKTGEVIFSSDPDARGEKFAKSSESCTPCHAQGTAPAKTGRSIHVEGEGSKSVLRFVQPVVAERACLECHDKAQVGQTIGVLVTDLDQGRLTAKVTAAARGQIGALGAAFLVLLASSVVITRFVVVSRLRNVKRLLDFVRAGTQTSTRQPTSFQRADEIDEIERLVHAVSEEVEDRQAIDRAVQGLQALLLRCREPAVLLDPGLRLLSASPAFLERPDAATAAAGEVLTSGPTVQTRSVATAGNGWVLGELQSDALWAALEAPSAATAGWLGLWSDAGLEAQERPALPARGRTDAEWLLYTAALASGLSTDVKRWRGVQQLDRRLNSGRRMMSELAALAASLARERSAVDLRQMLPTILWDLHRQVPDVSWHALLEEDLTVTGTRYQLRALVQRLARAAATQAGTGGHAVLFSQRRSATGKIYLGAWASSSAKPGPLDEGLPLCALLARNHGGGLEVDSAFDLGPLCQARGVTLPCELRGVLFVAEIAAR